MKGGNGVKSLTTGIHGRRDPFVGDGVVATDGPALDRSLSEKFRRAVQQGRDIQDAVQNPPVCFGVQQISRERVRFEHLHELAFGESGALQCLPPYLWPIRRDSGIERDRWEVDLREGDPESDVDERVTRLRFAFGRLRKLPVGKRPRGEREPDHDRVVRLGRMRSGQDPGER